VKILELELRTEKEHAQQERARLQQQQTSSSPRNAPHRSRANQQPTSQQNKLNKEMITFYEDLTGVVVHDLRHDIFDQDNPKAGNTKAFRFKCLFMVGDTDGEAALYFSFSLELI
jgi:hypothetical protein